MNIKYLLHGLLSVLRKEANMRHEVMGYVDAVVYEYCHRDSDNKVLRPNTWRAFIVSNASISVIDAETEEEAKTILKVLLREEMPGFVIGRELIKYAKHDGTLRG